MRFLRKAKTRLRGEAGFSLAEVLISGFILALAVFPMVGMFDGAYLVARQTSNVNLSSDCLRMYTEKVMTLPFYKEHKQEDLNALYDVDDYYWGSRNPIYNNAWSAAPEVSMKEYDVEPYPDMRVTVKMAFVDDEKVSGVSLEQAAESTQLATTWQPRALYGYDRPKSKDGKSLNVILYEVKVYTRTGQTFSTLELYTSPTDVVANVYLDKVVNVSADSTKKGTRYNEYGDCISAPHTQNGVTIRAYGEGFTAADVAAGKVQVKLVRLGGESDITLKTPLTYGEDGDMRYVESTIDLNNTGIVPPYKPRKMPGYYYSWLVVNHVISVKSNAFIIEYPQPVWHPDYKDSSNDKQGLESTSNETLTFNNLDYVMNFVTGEYPNPGIGAVVQLEHTVKDDNGNPIDKINGTNLTIAPSAANGYQAGLTVTASFDFRGHIGGDYMVRVINCIDRATPDKNVPGNTYFELDDPSLYYHLEGPPAVNEVYVYEDTPTSPSLRHFAYDDRAYQYTLEIKGYNFDNMIDSSMVTLGLGGDVGANPPTGATNEINPISVEVLDSETIRAVFDFALEVSDTERGEYWLYVKNTNNFGRLLNPAFDIREPRPIIYGYTVQDLGLWQNYWDIGLGIVGECFDEDVLSGTGYEVRIKEKATPANDWLATEAMATAPVASDMGRRIDCKLNLIGCGAGDWELYVKSTPSGETDSGYTDARSGVNYTSYLPVSVGAPTLLTTGVPAAGKPWSIKVMSRYRNWNSGTGDWKEWRPWRESTEGGGNRASVYEDDEGQTTENNRTQGVMYFVQLRGMGFNNGTVDVNCVNDQGENTPGMNATWDNFTVKTDRANLLVWIEMTDADAKITGPHIRTDGTTNYIRLRIRNDATGTWTGWFTDRIQVDIGSSY